jgi:hypothetical protein
MTSRSPPGQAKTASPNCNAPVAMFTVRFTSISLKNSNFRVDHSSEDRWRPRWKIA